MRCVVEETLNTTLNIRELIYIYKYIASIFANENEFTHIVSIEDIKISSVFFIFFF